MFRALLISLEYPSTPNFLPGCYEDGDRMYKWLTRENHGFFSDNDIDIIRDDIPPSFKSTLTPSKIKALIVDVLHEYAHQSHKSHESHFIVFYSGHGTSIRDTNKDERDGKDEAWFLGGDVVLSDDELYDLTADFHPSSKLTFVFDCCHSGTMGDIPFKQSESFASKKKWTLENGNASRDENNFPACVVLAGCRDSQSSYTSLPETEKGIAYGKFTDALLFVLRNPSTKKHLFGDLIRHVNERLNDPKQIAQLSATSNHVFTTSWFGWLVGSSSSSQRQ